MRLALLPALLASLVGRGPLLPRRCAPRMGFLDDYKAAVDGAIDGVKTTVEGVKAEYEDESFVPDGFVRASHILFLVENGGDAQAAEAAEAAAERLRQRIVRGELSFGEAALRFSHCPTRDLNGNLGTFQSLSRLGEGTLQGDSMPYDGKDTAPFDRLVLSPDVALNQVHKVRTQWGTHLVLVEARGGSSAAGQAADLPAAPVPQAASSSRGFGAGKPGKRHK